MITLFYSLSLFCLLSSALRNYYLKIPFSVFIQMAVPLPDYLFFEKKIDKVIKIRNLFHIFQLNDYRGTFDNYC